MHIYYDLCQPLELTGTVSFGANNSTITDTSSFSTAEQMNRCSSIWRNIFSIPVNISVHSIINIRLFPSVATPLYFLLPVL